MFHKEGTKIILTALTLSIIATLLVEFNLENSYLKTGLFISILTFLGLILQFFRNPKRTAKIDPNHILAPVDGKVVIIEKVFEKEYFKDERLQVSIFMSPINVHVTRYPASGEILFAKYHPGKYLVAWHPKSSELNERTTNVIKTDKFGPILYRQIAGLLARRIVNYAKVGTQATQGTDAGFIKFGSRVDLFLPVDTKVDVQLNQVVKGAKTIIAQKDS